MKLDTLFSPFKIGTCEIPSRLVVPAMVTNYCTADGFINERYLRYMEEKAKGGWGLLITEDYNVQEHRQGYTHIPSFWSDEHIAGNVELTSTIHKYDTKIFCQMYHPGRQVMENTLYGLEPQAPSATTCPVCQQPCREITVDEIHQLVADFGQAARRAKEAGFDGIELHCAHGYLLAEFLSPAVNRRVDEYGGCFDNRVRIVDEILVSMRAQVGADFPIIVRISSDDLVPGGRTIAETLELCRHLEEIGFDDINCSNGMYASKIVDQIIAPMFIEHALNMDRAEEIKQVVDIPVILSNRVNDPKMADTLLKMGKADAVAMGRGSLADPDLPNKAKRGKFCNVRYCIGCLQAALTAAQRGHDVIVYEEQSQLGGQFRSAAYPVGKGELATYASSLRADLADLNVPVRPGVSVDEALIEAEKPEAIVVATGAKPLVPPVSGIENAAAAEDVLLGKAPVAMGPVVVCGGGEVGAETAHYLSQTRQDITLLEMQDDICKDMMPFTKQVLVEMINEAGIKVRVNATVKSIAADGVTYADADGTEHTVLAATVVSGFGYKAYNPLEEVARKYCDNVQVVGCAIKAGNAVVASREGFEAGPAI